MTHPYLPDLDQAALDREITGAKAILEQMLGATVEHFSCPGGRYDSRTVQTTIAAGFRTLATSVPRTNTPSTDAFSLGRIAVTRGVSPPAFADLCRGEGLWKLQFSGSIRNGAIKILGNRTYDQLRAMLLGK